MLKEACNNTLPSLECLLPNYTLPWANNLPMIELTRRLYYVATVMTAIPIAIIGLITSIACTLIFFIYPITQMTTRYLLIINSIEDALYLTILALIKVIGGRLQLGEDTESTFKYTTDLIAKFVEFYRNWTIVFIAFERFMLICYPLHVKRNKNGEWFKRAFIGLTIFTLLVRIPTILTLTFELLSMCYEGIIVFSIEGLTDALFFTLSPLCLLTFFTVRILLKTRSLQTWRKTHSTGDGKHTMAIERMNKRVHKTIMIVLIAFVFFMFPFVPNGVIRIMVAFGKNSCMIYLLRYVTAVMAYLGTLLNSSINFFVYLITWPKFRICLWRLVVAPFICDFRINIKDMPKKKAQSTVTKNESIPTVQPNTTIKNSPVH
nr:Orphan Rhodopsin-like G protein-coupled receptor [Hymenolepis microstoma]